MKKFYLLLIALLFLVISCKEKEDAKTGNTSAKEIKRISINENEGPESLNPNLTTDSTGTTVNSIMSEGLMRSNKDGVPVAGLAEKWETSEDGLVWKFYLRENLKWSDGSPLTANDFKFSWMKVLEPETGAKNADLLYVINGAEAYNKGEGKAEVVGIKVLDDKTIEVVLEEPSEYFLSLLAHVTYSPISEKLFNEKKEEFGLKPDSITASGPYQLKEWNHNANIVLVKNENYWNKDEIKLDEIEIKLVVDNEAALNAFNNGEIDLIRIGSVQYEKFRNDERIHLFQNNSVWFLLFNMENDFLKNPKIRKAIQMSINREKLIEKVLSGTGNTATGLIPNGIMGDKEGFRDEAGIAVPDYNTDEAKKLFAEGLKELGMTKPPKLNLLINDALNNKSVAEFAQEQLRVNLGLEIEIEAVTYKERVVRSQQHDFDLVFTSWKAIYADPKSYLDIFVSGAGNNYGVYSNKKYDEEVSESNKILDRKERIEKIQEAEKTLVNDMPAAFLYFQTRIVILNPRVKNIYFKGVGAEYYLYEAELKE